MYGFFSNKAVLSEWLTTVEIRFIETILLWLLECIRFASVVQSRSSVIEILVYMNVV